MEKIIISLNPNKVYIKSQAIIIITLISLMLCVVSWWFLVPTLILALYNLIHPALTLFEIENGQRKKVKATRKAWQEYRTNNKIPWKAQWDYYQISFLISHKESKKNKPIKPSTYVQQITKATESPVQLTQNNQLQIPQPKIQITQTTAQVTKSKKKIAVPKKVKPLPKLNVKLQNVENMLLLEKDIIEPTKDLDKSLNEENQYSKFGLTINYSLKTIEFDDEILKFESLHSVIPDYNNTAILLKTLNKTYTYRLASTDSPATNLQSLIQRLYELIEKTNKDKLLTNFRRKFEELKESNIPFENNNLANFKINEPKKYIFIDNLYKSGSFQSINFIDIKDAANFTLTSNIGPSNPNIPAIKLFLNDNVSFTLLVNKVPIDISEYDSTLKISQAMVDKINSLLKTKRVISVPDETKKINADLQKNNLKRKNDDFILKMKNIHPSKQLQTSKASYNFRVAGVTHHELAKAISFARSNYLFDPFDGYTASEIRDDEIDEDDPVFETDLTECIEGISLIPEPDNKYDPNAIKVGITIDDQDFFIGYVPADWTEHVHSTLTKMKKGIVNVALTGHLTGGRNKFLDIDNHVRTKKLNYGFVVEVHTKNKL